MTTPLTWMGRGFRGMTLGGAQFGAAETGVIAGFSAAVNAGLSYLSFEAGINAGSEIGGEVEAAGDDFVALLAGDECTP